ncbi:MAG: RNA-binding protein [Candidatus Micrarchaeota archaeon]|nr:RNA-binding protein [Candidatus Micrarchaeota archaeon]
MGGRRLSNSEIKELNAGGFKWASKKDIVEVGLIGDTELMKINGKYCFFKYNKVWVPTLRGIYAGMGMPLKGITVDAGAIRFVSNGADVMRPGIVRADEGISRGDIVLIYEILHNKVIALGEALLSSDELKNATSGKAVKNIHYVGDKIWSLG